MAGAASVLTDATPAAPSAPVRKNLRRCMMFLPGTFLILPVNFHSAEPACHGPEGLPRCKRKSPAEAGLCEGLKLFRTKRDQSLFAADWRGMKLSKVFSATRNHSTSSFRDAVMES